MRAMILALFIASSPAFAETPPTATPTAPPTEEGWSLMERGAKMLLDGLMAEVEPTLDEMGRALSEIEPALREMQPTLIELMALLGDFQYYKSPEKLPNGDIIIRRKTEMELRLEGLTGPDIDL